MKPSASRSLLLLALLLPGMAVSAATSLLDGIPDGRSVAVPGFAYSAQRAFTGPVILRRTDIYAEDARVYIARPTGLEEIARSDLQLFVADPGQEPQRMYLAVSADGRSFEGAVFDADGTFAIRGEVVADRLNVHASERLEDGDNQFECGGSPAAPTAGAGAEGLPTEEAAPEVRGATHQALVAVDTDNEFMNLKFGNNATNANNYIAALFTGINVFYERDLSVRLQLGTVVLRPSTTPDPYPSTSATPIEDQLDEFGDFWRLNQQTVPRAFAAQLSGKSSNANSASGIAWLINSGSYCSATGTVFPGIGVFGHYGVTRVFRFAGSTAANDVAIVGHEIGHNFGALHTHCSSSVTGGAGSNANQLIDRCFNAEVASGAVCHSGTPTCPTDNSVSGRGSLMSYCNFGPSAGANCGPVLQEFHPAHQLFLGGRVQTNIGNGCLTPLGSNVGPLVSALSPANGSTTGLGGGTIGAQVSGSISFSVSGGSGGGTTQLSCSVGSGSVQVVSGTPQTIAVGGSAGPVGVRFILGASAQSGVVNCSAVRQGAATSNFSYTFTAAAGTPASPQRIFCSGFEPGQTGVCSN